MGEEEGEEEEVKGRKGQRLLLQGVLGRAGPPQLEGEGQGMQEEGPHNHGACLHILGEGQAAPHHPMVEEGVGNPHRMMVGVVATLLLDLSPLC